MSHTKNKNTNDPKLIEEQKARRREAYQKYMENPETRKKRNAQVLEKYHKNMENPEYREKRNARVRKQYANDPEKCRNEHLKYRYGIKPEEYFHILEEQEGKCKICGIHQSELKNRLVVDHCHTSKKVRGLLCAECNTGMGKFKDDPNILEKAKQYLESFIE